MTDGDRTGTTPSAPLVVPCNNLDAAIAFYTGSLGFRLDMIMPADTPRVALLSGDGITLRLQAGDAARLQYDAAIVQSEPAQAFVITRADTADASVAGRAGMQYRDLIPGRFDGHVIASHIRIPNGGPVPDYVHYHQVGFQMIYCIRGWARVVYEDQGPAFVMQAGDCVLQPPTIRHRVLEASSGFEVIEISSPAEHETWRDHALELPTMQLRPERIFGGQRFVRHIAADAVWQRNEDPGNEDPGVEHHGDEVAGCEFRDTGISAATDGLASVRVLRMQDSCSFVSRADNSKNEPADFSRLLLVLDGRVDLISDAFGLHMLGPGDVCVIPADTDYTLDACMLSEVLEVELP